MQAEIIIVPTPASLEMLKESAQQLARHLTSQGIHVHEEISLCPDRKRLQHAISKALGRSEALFTLGGMGRDSQFLAKQVMSEGLGLPLEHSRETMLAIEQYATRRGISLSPEDAALASLPSGSRPLLPTRGILPGCVISSPSQHIVLLPENAEEILPMLTQQVMPILAKAGLSADSTHHLRAYGLSAPQVHQMITDLIGTSNPVVTIHPDGEDEVLIRVSAKAATVAEAAKLCTPVLRTIATRLGDYAYGLDVDSLEEAVAQKLDRKALSVAVAEAGSGGLFIDRMSRFPEGNHHLDTAIIADSDDSKIHRLGFTKKDLRRHEPVSEWMAVAMADAVRHQAGSQLGVGIASDIPRTQEEGQAVSYIAVCDENEVYVKKVHVQSDRHVGEEAVADVIISRGLNMLRLFVDYYPEGYSGNVPIHAVLDGRHTVTDKDSYASEGFVFQSDDDEPEEAPLDKKKKKKKTKTKNGQGKAKKRILAIAILVFVLGAAYLIRYGIKSVIARGLRDDIAEVYDTVGIEGVHSLNNDTVGFLSLDGTNMRYPVVQAKDNDYYLRRDFNEKSNQHGVPFMDYQCDSRKPSDNLIIYGHNMRDGQIFGELLHYKDVAYYQEHPVMTFETLKNKGRYKVFAVFITSADPNHFSDGTVFNYHQFIDARSPEEFDNFIQQVRIRSLINMPVDVEPGDQLLTLSTCDYDFSSSRYVVMARKVRRGESEDVDVAQAAKNPTPLYPDVWYQTYGGSKPDIANWNYQPPAATQAQEDTREREETPSEEPDTPAEVEEETPTPAAPDTSQADRQQQEAARKAEEQRQAQQQAEQKKKAEEEAARKAEEDKKKAEEEAAKKAADEKAKAEETAVAAASRAAQGATDAQQAHNGALNATTRADAQGYADTAAKAASSAEAAAAEAKQAAALSGTNRANQAANDAAKSAAEARRSANTAAETAKLKDDDWDVADTATLSVRSNQSFDPEDTLDILARITQNEVGTTFHPEAIKAQAVASYTFIQQANASGTTPYVSMAPTANATVKNNVKQVLGQAVYYNGSYAFTPYHATSAGSTTSSQSVWGGSYPYLVPVNSSVDRNARGYQSNRTMSSSQVSRLVEDKLGITTSGDPSGWFQVLSEEPGGYNGRMSVCGETRSPKSGATLTGRLLRESVFGLRSACFDIDYSASNDTFTFTTYGYGHGVGLSQNGANQYAQQGWNYKQILEHYYPGATVK